MTSPQPAEMDRKRGRWLGVAIIVVAGLVVALSVALIAVQATKSAKSAERNTSSTGGSTASGFTDSASGTTNLSSGSNGGSSTSGSSSKSGSNSGSGSNPTTPTSSPGNGSGSGSGQSNTRTSVPVRRCCSPPPVPKIATVQIFWSPIPDPSADSADITDELFYVSVTDPYGHIITNGTVTLSVSTEPPGSTDTASGSPMQSSTVPQGETGLQAGAPSPPIQDLPFCDGPNPAGCGDTIGEASATATWNPPPGSPYQAASVGPEQVSATSQS
jgi:hypothetical protein